MWRDIRYAAHGLRRNPLFTLAAVLALGLAIGANATIFGLADGLWLRPPAVTRPGDLVRVFQTTETSAYGTFSYPEYTTLRDETSSFSGVIARGRRGAVMAGADGLPEILLANVVSLNFFTALGVAPEHGRVFTPDDEAALEAGPGIVLGHAFWRRRFGGDPSVVGQSIDLGRGGRVPVKVLGVLPESFRELDADSDRDLWMPPETWAAMNGRDEFQAQDNRWFDVVGRLGEGIGVLAAHDEVVALAAGMARDFPGTNAGRSARAVSDIDYRLETGGVNAMALLGLVLIVVLITCVNIANLLLARTAARTRELAVRVALGAGRWPLLRQLMVESGLIGACGAVCGLLVAAWLFRLVPGILVEPPGFRSFAVFEADARVVMFTVGLTLVTTFLFGIVPALVATRTDVALLIKGESALGGSRRLDWTFRQVLVVGQVAVSLVLLYAASVLAQSFVEARSADLGFARRPILAAWVPFGAAPQVLTSDASRQLEQLPGVTHVAVAIRAPLSLSGGGLAQPVFVPGQPVSPTAGLPDVKFNAVSANYFETMGTRVVRGRRFDDVEARDGSPVLVVSEAFASRFFPAGNAVDSLVRLGGVDGLEYRIVGVAADAVINRIDEPSEPYFYLPYWSDRFGEATFLIESDRDAAALAPAVRQALVAIDDRLDPRLMTTMAEFVTFSAGPYQATAALASTLGLVGLLLTTLGVYGVIGYRTSRRTREIGIRIALGAARGRILRLVLREGMRVGLLGLVIGVPLALVASRFLASLLFGISPWNWTSLLTAGGVLLAAVGLATFVPAWRATDVNPSNALRDT